MFDFGSVELFWLLGKKHLVLLLSEEGEKLWMVGAGFLKRGVLVEVLGLEGIYVFLLIWHLEKLPF